MQANKESEIKKNGRRCTFSVIIPTYNRAHVLARAIDSVLKQSYHDFELLIIDDGSTDKTLECVQKFNDNRIKYIKHDKNLGQSAATNTGIELAQGEYISFIHSDDEWMPEMLGKIYNKFQADGDVGCVYTLYGIKDNQGNIKLACNFSLEGHIYKRALEQGYVTLPTTLSVKKKCFDAIGNFPLDNSVCMDDDMCLRLAKEFKFGLVKEILGIIHLDAGGRISDDALQSAEDYYKLYNKFTDDIIKYCGDKTLAKHYTHSGILFLGARNRKMALKVILKGLKYSFSFKGVGCIVLSMLPFICVNKVRELRHSLRLAVEDREA